MFVCNISVSFPLSVLLIICFSVPQTVIVIEHYLQLVYLLFCVVMTGIPFLIIQLFFDPLQPFLCTLIYS